MRTVIGSVAGLVLGSLMTSVGFAQTPVAPPPLPGTFAGRESIPDREKIARSAVSVAKMREALKLVLTKLEEARASKDVVKLNCVNEKLTNIKGLLRISEQADVALQEAVAKREEQGADHEFTKVTIARGKVELLRGEAEQCVGLLAFETGETTVEVQEPDLPPDDPTVAPPNTPVVIRPPPASPTG